MRCLLERCPPYEVSVRELSAMMRCLLESVRHPSIMRCLLERCPHYEVSVRRVIRHMRCLLERCPPYEVSVREVSAI